MINKQVAAGENLQQFYDEKLRELIDRLSNMKATYASLKMQTADQRQTTVVQQRTLQEWAEISVKKFWEQDSRYINQVLHRLMGRKRLLLLNGEIVGVADVQRKQRRHS